MRCTVSRERPILFKPELVRGILDAAGEPVHAPRKLQTRRIVTELEDHDRARLQMFDPVHGVATFADSIADDPVPLDIPCRYGAEGDRLWVRETWGIGTRPCPRNGWVDGIEFKADDYQLNKRDLLPLYRFEPPEDWPDDWFDDQQNKHSGWRPSIHLPRWASRITLTLAEVRIERLQDITGEDAKAEGMVVPECPCERCSMTSELCPATATDYVMAFREAWDRINAKRATWDQNPWLWVLRWEPSGIEVRR